MEKKDEKLWKEAKERVDFKSHLVVYVAVNILLIVINLLTSPRSLWFYWVTIFWGFGLLMHGLGIYVFPKGRAVDKEYEKLKSKKKK